MADWTDIINTIIAEANGEGPEGMRRVGETILNRAAIRGLSPADVVRQPHQYTGFFAPGPDALRAQRDPRAISAAEAAWNLARQPGDPTNGADHYFNPSVVDPGWENSMTPEGQYGGHAFYSSRAVPAEALARLLTSTAPAPFSPPTRTNVPTDLIAQSFAGNTAAQARSAIANMFGPAANVNTPRLDAAGVVNSPAASLADWASNIFPSTARAAAPVIRQASNADPMAVNDTVGALKQDAGAGAALAALLGRPTTQQASVSASDLARGRSTAVGGPPTTRAVTSVRVAGAPKVDPVGKSSSFAEMQNAFGAPSVSAPKSTATANDQRSAQVKAPVRMNDIGSKVTMADLASTFGAPKTQPYNDAAHPFEQQPRLSATPGDRANASAPGIAIYGGLDPNLVRTVPTPQTRPAAAPAKPKPKPKPTFTTVKETVPNPEWDKWSKMDAPGEMPTWDSFASTFAPKKPEPPRTITVTRKVAVKPVAVVRPAAVPVRVVKPAPAAAPRSGMPQITVQGGASSLSAVDRLRAQGLSPSAAYDAANEAARQRALAGSKYGSSSSGQRAGQSLSQSGGQRSFMD